MDKKFLLRQNLADILNPKISDIKSLLTKYPQPSISYKADGSPVTELDLALSQELEAIIAPFPQVNFYSEENFQEWKFPLLALDPLDGTREYIAGRAEWSISVGLFEDENFVGEGWVYNPVTDELFSQGKNTFFSPKKEYCGEVSRSEWEKGLFNSVSDPQFRITPMGSIAYKLGRLSQGRIDFVVSLRPKNIWDIAGGSLLCQQSGIKFYSEGKIVHKVQKLYEPPLIWCRPELISKLSTLFPAKDIAP